MTPTPTPEPIEINDDEDDTTIASTNVDASVAANDWICPRCQASFTAPDELDHEAKKVYLTAQQHEHADYHFALDLQDGDRSNGSTSRMTTGAKPKVKKKKGEGIKAFFAPKTAK